MEIRAARPEEYDGIGELTVTAYAAILGSRLSADYAAELRAVAQRASAAEVLVAVEPDGTVLGSVTNAPDGGPYAEVARSGEAEFRMLAVDASARGRGVGQALVEHCLAVARSRGRDRMVLSTTSWMTTAHRLYERLGFRRTPDRDWEPVPGLVLLTYVLDL